MTKFISYLIYEILYLALWLSFIIFLINKFDSAKYLWLLIVMFLGGLYPKNNKEEKEVLENDYFK